MRLNTVNQCISLLVLAWFLAATCSVTAQDLALKKARELLAGGQPGAAYALLEPEYAAGNRLPERLRVLGKAAMGLRRPTEAVKFFKTVIDGGTLAPGDYTNLTWGLFEMAVEQRSKSGGLSRPAFLDAAEAAKKAVKADARDLTAWRFLAASHAWAQEDEKAAEAYQEGMKALGDKGAPLRIAYGDYLSRMGKIEEAVAEIEKILQEKPEDPDASLALARIWAGAGRLDRAVDQFKILLGSRPNHAPTYEAIWKHLSPPEHRQKGIALIKNILADHPKNLFALSYLGNFLSLAGDTTGAEAAYRACLVVKPDYAWAHRVLGELYHKKAIAAYTSPQKDPPVVQDLYRKAVKSYLNYFECAAAQKFTDRAVIPVMDRLLYNLARVALDPERAYRDFKPFLARFPEEKNLHHTYGQVCQDLGKFKEGEASIRKSIALCAEDDEWMKAKYINDLGLLFEGWNKYVDARKEYEKAANLSGPGRVNALENLGKLAYKLGNPEKAILHFKSVLDAEPKRASSLFYYHLCRRWLQRETYFRRR